MSNEKIHGAMLAVMRDIGAIGKDRKNQQQGFMFRGIDQCYNALHGLMAKHGIYSTSEVLSVERQERATGRGGVLLYSIATIRYRFYAEDGSSVATEVIGEGMDSGDKASNKAMAIGHKYALLQAFMVPTEQADPDAETHDVAPRQTAASKRPAEKAAKVSEAQADELADLMNRAGIGLDAWEKATGCANPAELPAAQFETVRSRLAGKAAKAA